MNVVIRADASVKIGSGHVMRCLTLARLLKRHNMNVTFICRYVEGNYIKYIKKQGINVKGFHVNDELNDKVCFRKDANETIKIIEGLDVNLLIVDHYELDEKWEVMLRPYVKKMMVIDDLANRKHDCDLLLDQNYVPNFNKRYNGLVPSHCKTLLGPNYVLLREEFFNIELRKRTGGIKNVLIFFGGTDPTNETMKAIIALNELTEYSLNVDVIVGENNPHKYEIESVCQNLKNFNYFCQVENIAEFMQFADIMIGAGGAITWERCILRLPAITITIAENQVETTSLLHQIGATIYLGDHQSVTSFHIKKTMIQLLHDKQKVKDMIHACKSIIDFEKVKHYPVVEEILQLLGESR